MMAWPRGWRVHHGRDPRGNCGACSGVPRGIAPRRAHAKTPPLLPPGQGVCAVGRRRRRRRLSGPCGAFAVAADNDGQAHLVGPQLRCRACRGSGSREEGSARLLAEPRCRPRRHRLRAVAGSLTSPYLRGGASEVRLEVDSGRSPPVKPRVLVANALNRSAIDWCGARPGSSMIGRR